MNDGNWNDGGEKPFSGSLDPTSVNSQQGSYSDRGQGAYTGTQQNAYSDSRQDADPQSEGPQPMPSSDNMYRFQNVDAGRGADGDSRGRKKERSSGGMKRTVVSAVVFGVVAGLCFFGLMKITGVRFSGNGGGSSIGTVDTASVPEVKAVSGSAVGFGDVSDIVDRVMPSIVAITETSTVSSYFGQTYSTEGAGSGFIVKEDNDELLIVTNNHVVEGADDITVTFIDENTAKGTVKGTDSTSDLAVISVKVSDLKGDTKQKIKVASLGHSDDVKVGQMAIAIGNALGYGQSVTVGYISAKDREVNVGDDKTGATKMVLLQTDAAINPGNSGGALLDANGNVIGINSVKYADTKVEGIGYAIPMTDAVPIINELMNREVLKDEEKGYLGISGRTVSESLSEAYGFPVGVYINQVSENGAAKKAGIKQGDVITKINGVAITSIQQVQEKVNNTKAGTEITVTIARSQDGEYKEQELTVKLEGSETLNELDGADQNSSDSNQNGGSNGGGNPFGYEDDFYGDSYGGDEIMPW